MDGLPIGLLDGVGVVGVVLVVFWMIATGRLSTRKSVDELIVSHKRELDNMVRAHERELGDVSHDRDEWRAAHRISEQARLEEREHSRELLSEIAKPLQGFLGGFRRATTDAIDEVSE